jgi:hypothetical protein
MESAQYKASLRYNVVLKAHASDPYRPRVRVLMDREELPLANPIEVNLWEMTEEDDNAIQAPVDPAAYGVDPLLQL